MQAWKAFLINIEKSIGKQSVDKWLRPLKIVEFDACNLYLEAESSFQVEWFEEHVRKIANQEFLSNSARPIKIHFTNHSKSKKKREPPAPQSSKPTASSEPLDPNMLFTNFIFEKQDEMTLNLLKQLTPGSFNPLYLYGPEGVGKTHLLMAIGNLFQSRGLSVFLVHAETFTEHVVQAIRNSEMRAFREIYRNQDILMIDDIHIVARRAATQEELFHTFNALHNEGKQIILTSHLPPNRLEDIEPRLTSRFEWGIVLQIHFLTEKKMGQVLKNRARLHRFPLPDILVQFLMEKFSTSPKSMMRALEALMIRHKESSALSLEEAETLLRDLLANEKKIEITPEKIVAATASFYGIPKGDILGKSQAKEVALARKLAMYLTRKKLHLSYLAIGRAFTRDHSTVMTNIRQIEQKSGLEEIETALREIELRLTAKS